MSSLHHDARNSDSKELNCCRCAELSKDKRFASSRSLAVLQSETVLILGGFNTHSEELMQLVWLKREVLVGLLENFFLASWLTASLYYLSYWLF